MRPARSVMLSPAAASALGLVDAASIERSGVRLFGRPGGRLEAVTTAGGMRKLLALARRAARLPGAGQEARMLARDTATRIVAALCERRGPASSRPSARLGVLLDEVERWVSLAGAGVVPQADEREALADRCATMRHLEARLRRGGR